jgi:hypothetical protein
MTYVSDRETVEAAIRADRTAPTKARRNEALTSFCREMHLSADTSGLRALGRRRGPAGFRCRQGRLAGWFNTYVFDLCRH